MRIGAHLYRKPNATNTHPGPQLTSINPAALASDPDATAPAVPRVKPTALALPEGQLPAQRDGQLRDRVS
jgi:hypothetical protein